MAIGVARRRARRSGERTLAVMISARRRWRQRRAYGSVRALGVGVVSSRWASHTARWGCGDLARSPAAACAAWGGGGSQFIGAAAVWQLLRWCWQQNGVCVVVVCSCGVRMIVVRSCTSGAIHTPHTHTHTHTHNTHTHTAGRAGLESFGLGSMSIKTYSKFTCPVVSRSYEKKPRCGRGWWRPSRWPRRLPPSRGAAVALQLRRRPAPRPPR